MIQISHSRRVLTGGLPLWICSFASGLRFFLTSRETSAPSRGTPPTGDGAPGGDPAGAPPPRPGSGVIGGGGVPPNPPGSPPGGVCRTMCPSCIHTALAATGPGPDPEPDPDITLGRPKESDGKEPPPARCVTVCVPRSSGGRGGSGTGTTVVTRGPDASFAALNTACSQASAVKPGGGPVHCLGWCWAAGGGCGGSCGTQGLGAVGAVTAVAVGTGGRWCCGG